MLRPALPCLLAAAAMAADYHIHPAGDDAADGLAADRAWRTTARAVSHIAERGLEPGDRLLFAGGVEHALDVPLALPAARVRGSADRPITIAGYGDGRPTLSARGSSAISINAGPADGGPLHLRIVGLELRGDGVARPGPKACHGIELWTEATEPLAGLVIEGVEIHGFAGDGLTMCRDVRAARMRGVAIRRVVSRDNPGAAGVAPHSGSGIVVGGVDGAVIEDCVAARNGERNRNPGGPVGIWYWDAIDSVIRRCESFDNRSAKGDGGGFDLDGGCQRCVIERCYSHGNVGAGFLFAQFQGAHEYGPLEGNVVRFCLSVDDGRLDGYAGIEFWGHGGRDMVGSNLIHNVTVVMTGPATRGRPACVRFNGANQRGLELRDNVFIAGGGAALVAAREPLPEGAVVFAGNRWWSSDASPVFRWGSGDLQGWPAWAALGLAGADRYGDPGWTRPPRLELGPELAWDRLLAFAPAADTPLAAGGSGFAAPPVGPLPVGMGDLAGRPIAAGARWVGALAPRAP